MAPRVQEHGRIQWTSYRLLYTYGRPGAKGDQRRSQKFLQIRGPVVAAPRVEGRRSAPRIRCSPFLCFRTANLRNPKPKSNRIHLSLGANLLSSSARDPTGRGEFSERGLIRAPCHGSSEAHSPRQWAGRFCRVASFGDRDKPGGSPVELMRGARRNYRAHRCGRGAKRRPAGRPGSI